jgi:hypothetical protein
VEVVGCAFGHTVDGLGVVVFAPCGEHGEVGEDVVLGVAADPGSVSCLVSIQLPRSKGGSIGLDWKGGIPYVIEHCRHHSLLRLPHSYIQALGFALALGEGGLVADSTVGVHDLDRLIGSAVLD